MDGCAAEVGRYVEEPSPRVDDHEVGEMPGATLSWRSTTGGVPAMPALTRGSTAASWAGVPLKIRWNWLTPASTRVEVGLDRATVGKRRGGDGRQGGEQRLAPGR